MVLRQILVHQIALEYCGNKKGSDFVTVGKKNWIFSSDVCYDLSLWWHLPNWDISFNQIKMVEIPKKILLTDFCSYNIYSQDPNVLCIVIYICLHSCTAMVSHLLPFMADITHSHCFEYISIAIALHRCIIYMSRTHFLMWIQL